MGKVCTIFDAINKWYQDVGKQLDEIEKDPSRISEVVELRIDDIKLSKSDLEDIRDELEKLYYDYNPVIIEEFYIRDRYYYKQIGFDRWFDETFKYEDGNLVISTGFKLEYWRKDDDYSDPYEIDEESYEDSGMTNDEDAGYYNELELFD